MFVAGPYAMAYNGVHLGCTERGLEIENTFFEEPIVCDVLGDSKVDGVYTGGDCFFSMVFQEWNLASVKAAFWPYSTLLGSVGVVGRTQVDLALSLVLTVLPGTRAATVGPATITAPLSILAANYAVRQLFASRHRKIPMRMQALPYGISSQSPGTEYWYVTS